MSSLVALRDDDHERVGGGFGDVVEGADCGRGERGGRPACSRSTGIDADKRRGTDPDTASPSIAGSTSTQRRTTCENWGY